jgi:hypothetical protein
VVLKGVRTVHVCCRKKDLFLVYGSVSGPDGSVLDPDLIRSGGYVSGFGIRIKIRIPQKIKFFFQL